MEALDEPSVASVPEAVTPAAAVPPPAAGVLLAVVVVPRPRPAVSLVAVRGRSGGAGADGVRFHLELVVHEGDGGLDAAGVELDLDGFGDLVLRRRLADGITILVEAGGRDRNGLGAGAVTDGEGARLAARQVDGTGWDAGRGHGLLAGNRRADAEPRSARAVDTARQRDGAAGADPLRGEFQFVGIEGGGDVDAGFVELCLDRGLDLVLSRVFAECATAGGGVRSDRDVGRLGAVADRERVRGGGQGKEIARCSRDRRTGRSHLRGGAGGRRGRLVGGRQRVGCAEAEADRIGGVGDLRGCGRIVRPDEGQLVGAIDVGGVFRAAELVVDGLYQRLLVRVGTDRGAGCVELRRIDGDGLRRRAVGDGERGGFALRQVGVRGDRPGYRPSRAR